MAHMKTKGKRHPITRRRKELDLSGYALAKKVGITPTHLAEIESGKIRQPSVDLALRIAAALGVDVSVLFGQAA